MPRKITVATTERDRMTAHVGISLQDGRRLEAEADVGQPAADLAGQWRRLAAKFASVAEPAIGPERAGEIVASIDAIDQAGDIAGLMALAR